MEHFGPPPHSTPLHALSPSLLIVLPLPLHGRASVPSRGMRKWRRRVHAYSGLLCISEFPVKFLSIAFFFKNSLASNRRINSLKVTFQRLFNEM